LQEFYLLWRWGILLLNFLQFYPTVSSNFIYL